MIQTRCSSAAFHLAHLGGAGMLVFGTPAVCRSVRRVMRLALQQAYGRNSMINELIESAARVRNNAHARYSNFRVGAALEDASGVVHSGCNIENATYGLTICAERVALFKAISEGARQFKRIAIVTGSDALTPPCGACRQILWEFCGDIQIVLANTSGKIEMVRLQVLFPKAFDASFL